MSWINQYVKTVISYFMPRHHTLKFPYNFKAKRYNVNLMNINQSEPKHFLAFICDYMKKLNMMKTIPYHRIKWRNQNSRSDMTTMSNISAVPFCKKIKSAILEIFFIESNSECQTFIISERKHKEWEVIFLVRL